MMLTKEHQLAGKIGEDLEKESVYQLKTFTQTLSFLEHFLEWYPQMVILDVDLIKADILKFIRILQKLKKDLKILLIASSKNISICSQALSMGIITYLLKPISTGNVHSLIHSTLKLPHNSRKKEVK